MFAIIEEKTVKKPKEMATVISNVSVCVAWILGKRMFGEQWLLFSLSNRDAL